MEVKPKLLSQHTEKVNAVVLPTLASAQLDQSFNYNFQIWENYTLADPLFNKSDRIDLIIAAFLDRRQNSAGYYIITAHRN